MSRVSGLVVTRSARVYDLPAVSAIRVATWRHAYAGIVPDGYLAGMDAEREAARRVELFADRPDDEVMYVAERGPDMLGFVHGGRYRDPDAPATTAGEVYAIYVLPTEQANGVGAALLAAMTMTLRKRHHFDPLLLWVLTDNPPARAFYQRRGWYADGATHTYEVAGVSLPETRYRLD